MWQMSIAGAVTDAAEAVRVADPPTSVMIVAVAVSSLGMLFSIVFGVLAHWRASNALKVTKEDSRQTAKIAVIGSDVKDIKASMEKLSNSVEKLGDRTTQAEIDIGVLKGQVGGSG